MDIVIFVCKKCNLGQGSSCNKPPTPNKVLKCKKCGVTTTIKNGNVKKITDGTTARRIIASLNLSDGESLSAELKKDIKEVGDHFFNAKKNKTSYRGK